MDILRKEILRAKLSSSIIHPWSHYKENQIKNSSLNKCKDYY